MKNTICIIFAVFCLLMVTGSIAGGLIITMTMPEMYKATATIRLNMIEEQADLSQETFLNEILKKDVIFQKAASDKQLQEQCDPEFGNPMSKQEVYQFVAGKCYFFITR